MLRRLIGENVDLVWRPGSDLWPVKIDPSQIDQILANLCVNARDAIAGVGKLIVETGNSSLGEEYCRTRGLCTRGVCAKNLLPVYPQLKCLFMSGYTSEVIAQHGILDEGVQFIQKPFSKKDLAIKVRMVLEKS